MYHLDSTATENKNTEHVFSIFYEIKLEHPFLDDIELMSMINQVTGWEYPSDMKSEYKEAILNLLKIKN